MQAIPISFNTGTEFVAAYTCYEKYFGIHRDPMCPKQWVVTHIPTGLRIFSGRTRGHCVCKLRVLLRMARMHNDDWSTNPNEWPEYIRKYYRELISIITPASNLYSEANRYNIPFSA